MTIKLKIKKGLDLKIVGGIEDKSVKRKVQPKMVSLCPDDFLGITPKPEVKEGTKVKAGEPLFHDKKFEEIKIVSPISGVLKEIVRGDRRKILQFVIEPQGDETTKFNTNVKNEEEAKSLLAHSGLWAFMRQLPYGIVPKYNVAPRDIFVSGFDSAPLAPDYTILLAEKEKELAAGVKLLSLLTKGKVYFTCRSGFKAIQGAEMVEIEGPHPAGNIGVAINHIAPVNKGEVGWTLDALTLARIGNLMISGTFDATAVVALTGSEIENPHYLETMIGADLNSILDSQLKKKKRHKRVISGNVLTGITETPSGYLHYPYRQITVIPEGDDKVEFMGWASLSPKKMSISPSFPGHFLSRLFKPDARLNGGRRAMIMSGEYDEMMPMDIMPEFLIKAILSKNIDQMEELGIYEVVPEDFALAEFADTSKLELQKIVAEGLEYLRKELE